jgi:carboxyl-terminal processing protease
MKTKWFTALALAFVATAAFAQAQPKAPETQPPGFEQLRQHLFPKPVAKDAKGAKALYNATIDLWADNGLYFIDFKTGNLDYWKCNQWREKWKKRADEIVDDKDFATADLLAQMAVDELGRFNYYLPPAGVAEENKHSDPTTVGIGARFEMEGMNDILSKLPKDATEEDAEKALVVDDKHFITWSPFPGSPAEKAGMKEGDILKKIDGKDVNGMTLAEVMKMIKGKQGSQVKLELERKRTTQQKAAAVASAVGAVFANPFAGAGAVTNVDTADTENVKISITRDRFTYPVVHVTKLEDNVVVIKYDNFSAENGLDEMRAALLEVRKMKIEQKLPVKVILDLRGNPGGLLHFAVQIASYMIPEGTITTIKEREGSSLVAKRWSVTRDALMYTYPAAVNPQRLVGYEGQKHELILPEDVPLVCLINGNSYSASELMSGALQANHRAIIVGMPSGGKGEGQQVYGLPEGRRGKVIKFFFAPGDREIDWAGVHPDEGWQVEWKKPEKKGDDNQLDLAKKAATQEFNRIEAEKARFAKITEEGQKERKAKWEKQREEQRKAMEEALKEHREKLLKEKEEAEKKKDSSKASTNGATTSVSAGTAKPAPTTTPTAPAPRPAAAPAPTPTPAAMPTNLPSPTALPPGQLPLNGTAPLRNSRNQSPDDDD